MAARIHAIHIDTRRLDPAEAELRLAVEVTEDRADLEIRGRWVGPRCALRSTVDVAYPLRPAEVERTYRVIIPEPALWEPASPFLYAGILELWDGDQRLDRQTLDHGLRSVGLGPNGLRWNQRPVELRGVVRQQLTAADAARLRDRGINLLLTDTAEVEASTDQQGFWVIRRVPPGGAVAASQAVSLLGLLLQRGAKPPARGHLLGVEGGELPPGFHFTAQADGQRLTLHGSNDVVFGQIEL